MRMRGFSSPFSQADALQAPKCRRQCVLLLGLVCAVTLMVRYSASSPFLECAGADCFGAAVANKWVGGEGQRDGGQKQSTSVQGLSLGTVDHFDLDDEGQDDPLPPGNDEVLRKWKEMGQPSHDDIIDDTDDEEVELPDDNAKVVRSDDDEADPEVVATLAEFNKQVIKELEAARAEATDEQEEGSDEDETEVDHMQFTPFAEDSIASMIRNHKPKLEKLGKPFIEITQADKASIPKDEGIHIITTFFRGTYRDARFKEIMATLVSNLENPFITAIHLLWEVADPRYFIPEAIADRLVQKELHKKMVLTEVKRQPTYKMMFQYADRRLSRGAIGIVTNADIYFDDTLRCVTLPPENYTTLRYKPEKIKTRSILALSRRHSDLCGKMNDDRRRFDVCKQYTMSHDVFVFTPPVPKSVIANTGHTQNQGYGAENIVIYEFKDQGYRVQNPCFTIRAYHNHCSRERHYIARIINLDPPRPGSALPVKRRCDNIWVY